MVFASEVFLVSVVCIIEVCFSVLVVVVCGEFCALSCKFHTRS